jgi:hypothetical protein
MAVIKIVPMPGAVGDKGDEGAVGPQGPQGAQGVQGPAGADALWHYNGEYNPGAGYAVGDVVTYEGQLWYRKHANGGNVGDTPSEGFIWDLLAAKGADANVESVFSEVLYTVSGGALGTQPTFDGDPLFTGSYTKTGNLVHFRVNVLMTNITNFGTGQYYVSIPFTSEYDVYVRNGQLKHSSGDMYSISGHAVAGSNELRLYTTASNGKEVAFTSSVPVGLNTACDFHIFGSYFSTPNP